MLEQYRRERDGRLDATLVAEALTNAPAISNGRSPRTGLAYRAAAQFRAAMPGNIPSNPFRGIQS
jgi:hypothetical protein